MNEALARKDKDTTSTNEQCKQVQESKKEGGATNKGILRGKRIKKQWVTTAMLQKMEEYQH